MRRIIISFVTILILLMSVDVSFALTDSLIDGSDWIRQCYNVKKNADDVKNISDNLYVVKFDANGGNGTMDEEIFLKGKSRKLTENAFTKDNFNFKGWAESQDGTVKYEDSDKVKNLTKPNEVKTLYAVWEKDFIPASGKVAEAKRGDKHPHGKLGDQGDEVGFGKLSYKKGSHSRGIEYVVRASNGDLADVIATTATELAENSSVGYDQSSSKHRKLWRNLAENGPSACVGDISCSTLAMVSLKYACLTSNDYADVESLFDCDWRSETLVKEIKKVCNRLEDDPCVVYSYDEVKGDIKRGDILVTYGHTFVAL